MIILILTVCSILEGATCKDVQQTYMAQPGEISVWACARYGQHHASQWALEHPNWRISKFRCQRPSERAKA
jgi:hypothetical protein